MRWTSYRFFSSRGQLPGTSCRGQIDVVSYLLMLGPDFRPWPANQIVSPNNTTNKWKL